MTTALCITSILALATLVATTAADWRRRIGLWMAEPDRLAEPRPVRSAAYSLVMVLAAASALLGLGSLEHPLAPIALALAAYAAYGVAHLWWNVLAVVLALGLTFLAWMAAARAWFPSGDAGYTLGLVFATAHLMWLARFWNQQLDDDRPWTTTGRLIPWAWTAATLGLISQLAAVSSWRWTPRQLPAAWIPWLVVLLLVGCYAMLAAEARRSTWRALPLMGFIAGLLAGSVGYLGLRDMGVLEDASVARWSGIAIGLLFTVRLVLLSRGAREKLGRTA